MTVIAPPGTKKLAKLKSDMSNLRDVRESSGQNQLTFWSKFGVTQSGGSRYENGRGIPLPLSMLLMLYFSGLLNDVELAKAKKSVRV